MNIKKNYGLFVFFILLVAIMWFFSRYTIRIESFEDGSGDGDGDGGDDEEITTSGNNSKHKPSKKKSSTQQKQIKCILLGDSILNNTLYVPKGSSVYDIINSSIPTVMYARDGDTVSNVYNQLTSVPVKYNAPDVNIFLSVGGNDFLGGRPFPLVTKQYRELLLQIKHKMPECKLYVLNLYYPPTVSYYYSTITKWNEFLDTLASEGSEVTGVVNISAMRDAEYFTQKIEPSVIGGERIAQACINSVDAF